mmetsp:Transcript_38657/g.70365  ORF Transcript_38657/g.70365 Transcript_38657/m.70365 type:complete len:197 (+) Transcript_38657:133-723(+)
MFAKCRSCCHTVQEKGLVFLDATSEQMEVADFDPLQTVIPEVVGMLHVGDGLVADKEQAELQEVVIDFIKRASSGCPCTLLDNTRRTAEYRLDRKHENLLMMSNTDYNMPQVTCPLSAITDIFSYVEDGSRVFPKHVLQLVKESELDRLVMVVYSGEDSTLRLCFLEATSASRDAFLDTIRVLCVCAQSNYVPAEH